VDLAGGGDVGECAVAIIVVERGLRRLGGMEVGSVAAVDEEGVEIAVLIVINPGDAAPIVSG